MDLIKTTLEDREDGSQVFDTKLREWVTSDKDPVAVMSHVDYDAGRAEANNILVMVFGEDIPESLISVIYAIELSTAESFELDVVFALSAAGTVLHLGFQLSEYWLLCQNMPNLQRIAEGRDKTFPQDATDVDVGAFAEKYKDAVVFVSLKGCSNVTGAAVQALVEHCTGIQTIYLYSCSSITGTAVQALAEHCTGIQNICLNGCSSITDAAVQALAEHCTGIQYIHRPLQLQQHHGRCGAGAGGALHRHPDHLPHRLQQHHGRCGAGADGALQSVTPLTRCRRFGY
jgi:hypothetical protein